MDESRRGAERRVGEEEGWTRGREERSRVGGVVRRRGEEGRRGGEVEWRRLERKRGGEQRREEE